MRSLKAAIIGILLALSCRVPAVSAAMMTPDSVTLEILPGNRANQTITLENDSEFVETYALELVGVEFGESADDVMFTELSSEESSWVSLSVGAVRLDPGQSQSFEVRMAVPAEAQSQPFPLAIIATKVTDASVGVGVTSALASLLFLQVGQDLQADLAIDSFAAVPKNTHVSPVRFAALVQNTGAGLSEPEVGLQITNVWGREIAVVPMNPAGRRVPGYTNRVFSATWQAGDWRIGPYTATVYVFPDETAKVLTESTRVVLFPWQMLCILAVIMMGLMTGGLLLMRARRR